MKELDMLLQRYLSDDYDTATPGERVAFEALLDLPDPQILDYITGRLRLADTDTVNVISRLGTARRA
jgi:succinate dehydrogenase flavin-adding protein (antitoxin of CptAB toxin-antitoxin module)